MVVEDTDAKLAAFTVNKNISGMSKRLVWSLKGTGFTKVSVARDERLGSHRAIEWPKPL
jgi:hypothetical protein